MLFLFAKAGKQNSNNTNYQFWRQDNHPIELDFHSNMFEQRLNYLHNNPVEAGIVENAVDYLYSSATDYQEGKGLIVYMNQEGRGIGLINKLRAYQLQEQGMDTVQANLALGLPMDKRDYGVGAQILRDLGVSKIRLISNNPTKRVGLLGYGLQIVEQIPIEIAPNPHNEKYLTTKRDKMGHTILKNVK